LIAEPDEGAVSNDQDLDDTSVLRWRRFTDVDEVCVGTRLGDDIGHDCTLLLG
jgi:hypothetical protein